MHKVHIHLYVKSREIRLKKFGSGESDLHQPAVHWIVSGAQAGVPDEQATLGKLSASRLKFTGLSGVSPDYPVCPRPIVDCHHDCQRLEDQKRQRKQVAPDYHVCHRTIRCATRADGSNGRLLQTPTVG
jgi:hypothetical protein